MPLRRLVTSRTERTVNGCRNSCGFITLTPGIKTPKMISKITGEVIYTMNDNSNLKPVNPELSVRRIKQVSELPSVKKGYIDGIKYYYWIIMKERALSDYPDIYETLVEFGSELADLLESENADSVRQMSVFFNRFYPDGKLNKVFETLQLEVALDGISECLYNLKKLFHIEKIS